MDDGAALAAERSAMNVPGLAPGQRVERRVTVTEPMTTAHAGGRRILTAPAMIMEMEGAAQDVAQPFLPADHTTVGYEICIRHRRPTPLGDWFVVTAELLEIDGRHLVFGVQAFNARGKIGEGTLRRTIVRLGTLA
jgi:fluoroacetyl-CoA thioesterase